MFHAKFRIFMNLTISNPIMASNSYTRGAIASSTEWPILHGFLLEFNVSFHQSPTTSMMLAISHSPMVAEIQLTAWSFTEQKYYAKS